jgi:hypothetical protein
MRRVEAWPDKAQEELAEFAFEIDATLSGGKYHASSEELRGLMAGSGPPRKVASRRMRTSKRFSSNIGGREGRLYRRDAARLG